jgi:hypothetical protein
MNLLEQLESWFAKKIETVSKGVAGAPQQKTLLEVCKDIQEDLRGRILSQDRGLRSFPYSQIDINIFTDDEDKRAAYDAVLSSDPPFAERLRAMLLEEGCRLRDLSANITVAVDPNLAEQPKPYTLRCSRATTPSAPVVGSRPAASLTVVRGEAETNELEIVSDRTNIGRMKEVSTTRGEIIRINQLAFQEVETTVAREHAYIQWDKSIGRFLLYDHMSGSRGTRLFRSGESLTVPKGGSKGTALEDGDEIHLGATRIRFSTSA